MKYSRALLLLAGLAAVCAPGQTQSQTPVFSTGQAARLVIGQVNFTTGNYGTTSQLLGSPSGVAYDKVHGILWVVDSNRLGGTPNNNRVLRFSDVPTYPSPTQDPTIPGSTCGVCRGNADLVLGQPDFISNDPSPLPTPGSVPTATGMRSPTAVATDGKILAVADTDNNRVLIWLTLPTLNGQAPDVVVGQPDFTHNATAVPPTPNSLRGPAGVWIDSGKLYIADTQDNRVLIYNKIPTANNTAADVVVGAPDFTTPVQLDLTQSSQTPTASNVQTPVSVTTDPAGRMFVADLAQNRVLIWNKIPTTNGAPADVALGQINLTTSIGNNSYTTPSGVTLDSDNNPETVTPVMCQSNASFAYDQGQTGTTATDSAGTTIYPSRCAATMSLPRFALSDGTRLFVVDGGNDRILLYNTIPTQSGVAADVILGEPDEFSDNTGQNPDGTDALQTPVSIAWDGVQNLYVGDTYNRRVVVYSPGQLNIPLGAVRNSASLNIYAIGTVAISGGIQAKDTVTITINGTAYTYTVVAADTLGTITDNLVKLINKGPDPNVSAGADDITDTVVLTARTPGTIGSSVTLAASVDANAMVTATASGSTLNLYLENPTSIAPGTLIEVSGTNLCDNTASGDLTNPYLSAKLAGCELFIDGQRVPLLYVSPTQINAQMPIEYTDRTSVSLYARATHADGSISVTSPIAVTIVPQNPGIFAGSGQDPRPGFAFHSTGNATSVIAVGGAINAGDMAAITIGPNTYTYTVLSSDTLLSVTQAIATLINSAPDPNVTASVANEYESLILTAIQPGAAGENIAVSQTVTGTNASLSLTIFNATTCCDDIQDAPITINDPAQPGEVIYVLATGIGPTFPNAIATGQVTPAGYNNPPAVNVDSILTGGVSANILSVTLVPGTVGVYKVLFQIGTGVTTDLATQTTIAQQAFVSNVVTIPIIATPTVTTADRTPSARSGRLQIPVRKRSK